MPDTPTPKSIPPAQLVCDWQDWLPYLTTEDISEAEKRALIEALWTIVTAFVDLGWDVRSTPSESCGQHIDLKAALEAAVVNSEDHHKKKEEA